jgi:hypothetical protein
MITKPKKHYSKSLESKYGGVLPVDQSGHSIKYLLDNRQSRPCGTPLPSAILQTSHQYNTPAPA